MKDKIFVGSMVTLGLMLIIFILSSFFGLNIFRPTIKIISLTDGTTVSTGNKLSFEVKIRGHFSEGISFVNERDLSSDGSGGWEVYSPNGGNYPHGNSHKPTLITFYKPGTYRIVAVGLKSTLLGGSEIIAKSDPITLNVVGPLIDTMYNAGLTPQ